MDEAEGGSASVSSQIVRMLRISEIHTADGAGAWTAVAPSGERWGASDLPAFHMCRRPISGRAL